jgi:pilus assembly protein CpaB
MFMNTALLRRIGPAFAAFVLVALGVLVLANGNKKSADAANDGLRATVVAVAPIASGTSSDQLGSLVEVRMLPTNARAQGAVESVAALPSGVVAIDLVPGQQVLASNLVDDVRNSLGKGRVAVSARLDPAQWTGPVSATGTRVNVYAIGGSNAELIATDVIVLASPDPSTLTPQQEAVITLGVTDAQVARVIGAVSGAGVWLVTA